MPAHRAWALKVAPKVSLGRRILAGGRRKKPRRKMLVYIPLRGPTVNCAPGLPGEVRLAGKPMNIYGPA